MEKKQSVAKLKSELQKHLEKQLFKGDAWYLIHNDWMEQCKKYVDFDDTMYDFGWFKPGDEVLNPGPIDNKELFKVDNIGEIRDQLIDGIDYVLVPEEGWTMLVEHFKIEPGQNAIARKVVEHGMFVKHCKVEIYYLEFQLADNSDLETVVKKKFSRSDTLECIEKLMRKEFKIIEDVETRLWNKYTSNTYEKLTRLEMTVQDAGLFSGQLLIIEQKNEDGTWPRQAKRFSEEILEDRTETQVKTGLKNCRSFEEILEDREGTRERAELQVKTGLKIRKDLHKFKYETTENEKQFVEDMKTIYSFGSFSDLVIFCGDKKFFVHKNILASRSTAFREMLEKEEEKIQGDLEITDTHPDAFKIVIDHIYTGKIPNNIDSNPEELFRLATKYNLQFLTKACELSLLEQLTNKNALETLALLDKHKSTTDAKNDVIKYITLNANKIIDTEKFQEFADKQPKLMIEIVRRFATNQNS